MATSKKPQEESRLHSRNKNRDRYDLNALIVANPDLKAFVKPNKHGDDSVDFANPLLSKSSWVIIPISAIPKRCQKAI